MKLVKEEKDLIINVNTVVVKNKDIDDTDIDGEKVMMDMDKGKYFMMNIVGADIWSNIDEPINVQAIIMKLLEKYDVDYITCESEVINFIEKLRDAELVNIK